jgi:hypothetical protein
VIGRRGQVEDTGKAAAFCEPDGERAVPPDQDAEVIEERAAEARDVQEREQHRDVRGNPDRRGRIEPPPPVPDNRLGFVYDRQQRCLARLGRSWIASRHGWMLARAALRALVIRWVRIWPERIG